jgi:hypothetical protein
MTTRAARGIAVPALALLAACGGGGSSSSAPGATEYSYHMPDPALRASYARVDVDNSQNTINLGFTESVVASSGSGFTLDREDTGAGVTVNGTHYGGTSTIEVHDSGGNVLTRQTLSGQSGVICTFSPREALFPYPLHVGQTWSTTALANCTDGQALSYSLSGGQVLGVESLTVPAGNFEALKLQYRLAITSSASSIVHTIDITLWLDTLSSRMLKVAQLHSYSSTPPTGYVLTTSIVLQSLQ